MHCRLGSLGRGGCFAALLRCLLMLAYGGLLADALPPYASGCFAAVIVLLDGCFATCDYFELGGCVAVISLLWRMLCRHGRAFRWMLRHHLLLRVGVSFLCRSSSSGGLCLGGLFGVSSPSVFLLLSMAVCEFVCIFSSVFLFC